MSSKGLQLCVALVMLGFLGAAMGQQQTCTNALTSMAPCLSYVTGNSTTPSSACCSQLGNVVQSSPQCLCSFLSGAMPMPSLGFNINQTLAVSLPGACQVQTPPISQCKAANGPADSPTSSEDVPSTTDTQAPSESNVPTGGSGSKNVPSTGVNGTSDGSIDRAPLHVTLFLALVVSFASTITKF